MTRLTLFVNIEHVFGLMANSVFWRNKLANVNIDTYIENWKRGISDLEINKRNY